MNLKIGDSVRICAKHSVFHNSTGHIAEIKHPHYAGPEEISVFVKFDTFQEPIEFDASYVERS